MVSTSKRKASVTSDSCDSGDEESRKRTKRSTPEKDEALFRLEAEKNFKGQKSSEKRGFLKNVRICVEDILRYVWDHCVEFVYKGAIFEENRVDGNVVTQLKQDNANLLALVKVMGDRIESLESQLTSHEEMITAINGTEYPATLAEQIANKICLINTGTPNACPTYTDAQASQKRWNGNFNSLVLGHYSTNRDDSCFQ